MGECRGDVHELVNLPRGKFILFYFLQNSEAMRVKFGAGLVLAWSWFGAGSA